MNYKLFLMFIDDLIFEKGIKKNIFNVPLIFIETEPPLPHSPFHRELRFGG